MNSSTAAVARSVTVGSGLSSVITVACHGGPSPDLDELKGAGLITRDEAGDYLLTDLGAALGPALESLGSWARHWSETLREADQQMGGGPEDAPGPPVNASVPAAPPQDYG